MAVFKQYSNEDYQLYREIQHQNNMRNALYYYVTMHPDLYDYVPMSSDFDGLAFFWDLVEGVEDEEFVIHVLDALATEFENSWSSEDSEENSWEAIIADYTYDLHCDDHKRFVKIILDNLKNKESN